MLLFFLSRFSRSDEVRRHIQSLDLFSVAFSKAFGPNLGMSMPGLLKLNHSTTDRNGPAVTEGVILKNRQ